MELNIKKFDELTAREVYEILKARLAVFVVEQEIIYQDLDDVDYRSLHVYYKDGDGRVTAYLRLFDKEGEPGTVRMGRMLSVVHGEGTGGKLLREGIRAAGEVLHARKIEMDAQCHAIGFYEKEGFIVTSEEFLEEGVMHVKMEKTL